MGNSNLNGVRRTSPCVPKHLSAGQRNAIITYNFFESVTFSMTASFPGFKTNFTPQIDEGVGVLGVLTVPGVFMVFGVLGVFAT